MKSIIKVGSIAVAAVVLSISAQGQTYSTSAQYGGYYGWNTGYSVNNDIWGSGAGQQTLYVNTQTGNNPNFWVYSQQPYTSGVKAYPSARKAIGWETINSCSELNGYYSHASSSGVYDWAFDCWVPSEVMVWTQWTSGSYPWGNFYQSNVSIGGNTYNVYSPGGPWSFLRTSQRSSGVENLAAIFKWLVNNGKIGNGTIGTCEYGVEITSGTGWWTCYSCAMY